jgi:uncharacterized membrane protein YqgA involved in biofilm formation
MKKAILPLVFAVAVLILFININKQLDVMGYIFAIVIGALVGLIFNKLISKLIPKKSKNVSAPNQTTTESVADEISEDELT